MMGARRNYLTLMKPERARAVFGSEYKDMFTKDDKPMLNAILTALDKEIPTVYRLDSNGLAICPNCSGFVADNWEYCIYCGQHIKSPGVE